jgi:hypothetical protein
VSSTMLKILYYRNLLIGRKKLHRFPAMNVLYGRVKTQWYVCMHLRLKVLCVDWLKKTLSVEGRRSTQGYVCNKRLLNVFNKKTQKSVWDKSSYFPKPVFRREFHSFVTFITLFHLCCPNFYQSDFLIQPFLIIV